MGAVIGVLHLTIYRVRSSVTIDSIAIYKNEFNKVEIIVVIVIITKVKLGVPLLFHWVHCFLKLWS